jgi:hypothetical protein
MRSAKSGESTLLVAAAISLVFAIGVAGLQAVGFGLRSMQLHEAAVVAARTMAHGLRVGDPGAIPCWQASDGLMRPAAYAEAEVCRAVVSNMGGLDPRQASVRVSQAGMDLAGNPTRFTVTVSYREPVSSPVLRLFAGDSFVATSDATYSIY